MWIGIHSLQKLIVTRWSADVICFTLRLCVIAVHAQIWMSGHAQNI